MYGLGSESRDLPGFVVLCPGMPVVGSPFWSSAFLPAVFQGTFLKNTDADPYKLIRNMKPQTALESQRRQLDLLTQLNREHLAARTGDTQLEASIEAMETAFRMQTEAPEAFDIRKEKPETLARYGERRSAAVACLRDRLVERVSAWCRSITAIRSRGTRMRTSWFRSAWLSFTDPAVASLIEDLKDRGMLQDTIVVLGTEFGRTPAVENGRIRNCISDAITIRMAIALRLRAVGSRAAWRTVLPMISAIARRRSAVHPHDVNATLLHLLGLDHTKLTYRYSGRDFRLTDVHGEVLREIIADRGRS